MEDLCISCLITHKILRLGRASPLRFGFAESTIGCVLWFFGIGEDDDGELYVLASDSLGPTGSTGIVYKIVSGEPVPTVSEWGMIVLALLLLIGAKIAFGGGRTTAMATIRT